MRITMIVLLAVAISGCSSKKSIDTSKPGIEWELVKNDYDGKGNFLAILTFTTDDELPANGWQLFFSLRYHGYNLESQTKGVEISHVNGELFAITPTAEFKPGNSFKMEFTGARKVANFQDVPSGFFYVGDDGKAVEISRTIRKPEVDLYNNYTKVADVAEPMKVLPTPVKYAEDKGSFTINKETTIKSDFDINYLVEEIEKLTGYKLKEGAGTINIRKTTGPPESYSLSVTSNGIAITAADAAGAFYATQSLKQLLSPDSWAAKKETLT